MIPIDTSFLTPSVLDDMRVYLAKKISHLPSSIPNITISEYAEQNRVLPLGTPFPGPWRNFRTPYLTEIMDSLSVLSTVNHVSVLKSAQIGMTAAAENVLAYWMDAVPSEILFASATEDSVQKWAQKRLEPMVDSCGFRDKLLRPGEASAKSRTSGDRALQKMFVGGSLSMVSLQSATSLRSESKRILLLDEVDGAPEQLRTGEGSFIEVVTERTNAWGARKKIFIFSTPTLYDTSVVYREYLEGDRRKFLVSCPHCGAYQELEWGSEKGSHGMRGETKAGRLHDVYYLCDHCHEPIRDNHKQQILNSGYWVPEVEGGNPYRRSYHISGLYSPVGMVTFWDLWEKYQKAQTTNNMRAFMNLSMGLPYRETGERPKFEKLIELRSDYKSKTIPSKDVLFLTVGIDVQRGSQRDEKNPPRLELEVVGHGAGFRSWSIEYRVIEGAIDDPYAGAWEKLREESAKGGFSYRRADGMVFTPQMWLIDSGDGPHTDVVYEFCRNKRGVFPSKGTQWVKKKKNETGDVVDNMNFKRYRAIQPAPDMLVYLISTNYYKHQIYNGLQNTIRHAEEMHNPDRPGMHIFPFDTPDYVFEMMRAEERRADGSFHNLGQKRNEALDCRVMAMCAADIYLGSLLDNLRIDAKQRGASRNELQKINHRNVLDILKKQVSNKKNTA